jgi:hypothetical protein
MKKKRYIANGRFFASLYKVQKYAEKNGWHIERTEVVKGMTLCYLGSYSLTQS